MNPLDINNLMADVGPGLAGIAVDVHTVIVALIGLLLILIGARVLTKALLSGFEKKSDDADDEDGERSEKGLSRLFRKRG